MRLTLRPHHTIFATLLLGALTLLASACSGTESTPETVVVTSIVEVPGPTVTVTSIVTEISIVEVPLPTTIDPKAGWPQTLVFGAVVVDPTTHLEEQAHKFTTAMSESLGIRVVLAGSSDADGLAADVDAGRIDLGPLTPTAYVTNANDAGNLELFAQSVRFGDATYHSQWFTNDPELCGAPPVEGAFYYADDGTVVPVGPTDSPALQVGWNPDGSRNEAVEAGLICPEPVPLNVVAGKTIAFTTETSPIGFIFPALQLRQAGITKDQYDSLITGGHDLSVAAVYDGTADIGVSFDDARSPLQLINSDVGSRVIVFNITPRIANDVFVVRRDLPTNLKEALFQALIGYIRTAEGQSVMFDLFGWSDLARADEAAAQSLEIVAAAVTELGFSD
jgi:phosphonate transport system substrate-binding protein